jgi:hypothetical protein
VQNVDASFAVANLVIGHWFLLWCLNPFSRSVKFAEEQRTDPGKHESYDHADYGIEQAQERLTPGVGGTQCCDNHYDGSGDSGCNNLVSPTQ